MGLLLCLLAALLAISAGTVASGATFTRMTGNPANVFSAGSFRLINSADGGYILTVAGLRPGQSVSGTLTLSCQGDLKGPVTFSNGGIADTPTSPPLSTALTLQIEDITGSPQTMWSGTMSSFSSLDLGQFSAGQSRTYRFTAGFPQAQAVPGLQGATSTLLVKVTGVAQ
jgi:hypothetical protein